MSLHSTVRRNERPDKLLIGLVLIVAAALRFIHLGDLSFSNDEMSAITRARYSSLLEMYRSGALLDGHPAGVQIFLFEWIKWFGDRVFMIRLPFALFSLGSIYLIYRIGCDWFNSMAGLLTAAFFAVMEFPLLYSIFARPYSPGLFFCLATVFFWTRLMRAWKSDVRHLPSDMAGFTGSLVIGVHTHYFAVVQLVFVCFTGFFLIRRNKWRIYFAACSAGAVSFLFETKFFLDLMHVGGLGGWLGAPGPDFLIDFMNTVFNGSAFVSGAIITIGLLLTIVSLRHSRFTGWQVCALIWPIATFLLAYGYSVTVAPILQASTLLFVLPFFLLFLLSGWPSKWRSVSWKTTMVAVVLVTGTWSTVMSRDFFVRPPFGVFKEVAASLVEWEQQYGRVPAVVNVIAPEYIDYYFRQSKNVPSRIYYKMESPVDLARLREIIDTSTAKYFAYGWSNCNHPYQIISLIRDKFPVEVEVRSWFNSEVRLFSKGASSVKDGLIGSWQVPYDDTARYCCVEINHASAHSQPGSFHFIPEEEYAPGAEMRIASPLGAFRVLYASVWFKDKDTSGDQSLCIAIMRNGEYLRFENTPLKAFNLNPGAWQRAVFATVVPPDAPDSMDVKVLVWNSARKDFYIDDLSAELVHEVDPYLRK